MCAELQGHMKGEI